jgi:hypothetical protein
MAGLEGPCERQAELTFAIARHAIVDLSLIFRRPPREPEKDRLPPAQLERLRATLETNGLKLRRGSAADQKLIELRQMYEPYVKSMSGYLAITIPPWIPEASPADNWQTSAWGTDSGFQRADVPKGSKRKHF